MESEWKAIPGFKRFEINKNGIIRCRKPGRKVIPWSYCTTGYPQVSIACDDGNPKTKLVHKLVASTFIHPLLPGEEINHKDKKKNNPRLENLEIFSTHKEHIKIHRIRTYGTCPVCGKEVRPFCKYCSPECRHKSVWYIRECKICGGTFEVRKSEMAFRLRNPRYKNPGQYCSNKCKLSDTDVFICRTRQNKEG